MPLVVASDVTWFDEAARASAHSNYQLFLFAAVGAGPNLSTKAVFYISHLISSHLNSAELN